MKAVRELSEALVQAKVGDMSKESLYEEVLKLPLDQRADLAAALLKSLDDEPEEEVEGAWAAEIERRLHDIRSGEVNLEDWKTVRDRARDRLKNQ